ncbi:MAG TPA: amidohydrolase, partial [Candidatus Saccharicenans sp.]|nr:amidohydrolase [Candidatus Saccharicenans sp.]
RLPSKDWIDAVSNQNPVCIGRYDLHVALVNSLALKIAGITRETKPPAGGEIEKDPITKEPTGILRDAAVDLVTRHIPEQSFKAKLKAIEAALEYAREHGITSVHDMAGASDFLPSLEVYKELFQLGRLSARICMYLQIDQMETWDEIQQQNELEPHWLSIGGLKGFSDGSLGAGTAYFFKPYADNPDNSGLLATQMFPEGIMEERILKADERGLQVAIHAIGDKANFTVLNIFEKVLARNGCRDRRWRIEHAQHVCHADIDRFARLGVIASMQPYHAIDDGRWAETKIGKERSRSAFAFNSFLEAGVTLAFGSDWPVAPLDPLVAIYAAVTRQTTDGKNPEGWLPEQKISLNEALKGFTLNGAYAEYAEKDKGSLEVGKLADLTVLDKDLFENVPEQIKKAKVTMTITGGRVVFERAKR